MPTMAASGLDTEASATNLLERVTDCPPRGEMETVLAVLRPGLDSPEHAAFIAA